MEGEYTNNYFIPHEILGYAPAKAKASTSRKYHEEELVYNVTYTIGENGLRISPPSNPSFNNQCAVFFGGSFTFGEGVNDDEAMPYVVGKLSKYEIYNFGFHGYGSHQMLSAIEHGMLEEVINCEPRFVIYQAIMGHLPRSAGYSSHDQHGPKYVISDDGLKYEGHFDDGTTHIFTEILKAQLDKSHLYKFFLKDRYEIDEQDIILFLEIIYASQRRLKEKYPNVQFQIILWNPIPPTDTYKMVRDGLNENGIHYHLITEILPEFAINKSTYEISEHDGHPNSFAHRLIAEYVVDDILQPTP